MEAGYKGLAFFFMLLFVLVIAGFFKTYFGLYPHFNGRTNAIIHFHAAVLLSWIFLLITQPLLILYKQNRAHRVLGRVSYFLVPLVVCSFVGVILKELNEHAVAGQVLFQNIKRSLTSIFGMLLFVGNYLLGILNRGNTKVHMRYMIATALVLIPPGLIRLMIFQFHVVPINAEIATHIFVDAFVVGLIIYDMLRKRNYRPYVVSLMLFFLGDLAFVYSRFL